MSELVRKLEAAACRYDRQVVSSARPDVAYDKTGSDMRELLEAAAKRIKDLEDAVVTTRIFEQRR